MVISSFITLSQVAEGKSFSGNHFPLVIRPSETVSNSNLDDCTNWIENSLDEIDSLLLKHGAILFRNFPVTSANDFDHVIRSTKFKGMKYIGKADDCQSLSDFIEICLIL